MVQAACPIRLNQKKNELCCVFKANKVRSSSCQQICLKFPPVRLTRLREFHRVTHFIQTVITVTGGESTTYQVPNLRPASLLPAHSFLHGHSQMDLPTAQTDTTELCWGTKDPSRRRTKRKNYNKYKRILQISFEQLRSLCRLWKVSLISFHLFTCNSLTFGWSP